MKQQAHAMVRIREMILQGHLAPGQRVPEALIAERLGISRTPVRQALPVLAEEGLLIESGTRGFVVRAFGPGDILEAIEVRGALEGIAARTIAERGAPRQLLRALRACLADGDDIFAKRHLAPEDGELYGAMNARFHKLIVDGAERPILQDAIVRVMRIPFAAPGSIAFDVTQLDRMYELLWYAHRQHHEMTLALEAGEAARVEALMREHIHSQKHSMNLRRSSAALVETSPKKAAA